MAGVTGIGGVFFLAREGGADLRTWYEEHLGMKPEDFGGVIFPWHSEKESDGGMTVWHIADGDSEWFRPSEAGFMINYRVDDLEKLLSQLTDSGVEVLQGPEYHENGIFAWIRDPDGNKVELWQAMPWDDSNKR